MTTPASQSTASPDRPTARLRVALVVASVRHGRFADTLAPWLEKRLAELPWLELDVVDLAASPLDPAMATPSPLAGRLGRADAFVFLTPEYNHGYPAALKLAIDHHREEWARKPVTFVAYGAGSGGIRAVEQLRTVLPELHAASTRSAVHLANPWDHVDDGGTFTAPEHVEAALRATVADLRWWAATLRDGRATHPVPA